jgi:L-asparaginase
LPGRPPDRDRHNLLEKAPVKKLNILTTGGTIDKIYYDDKSDYQIGEPEIGRILKAMNVAFDWEIRALLRKDSLNMSDEDRALIRQAVATSEDRHFLITHGTDTMVETAAALGDVGERVIVMTGALNPARFIDSDAVFNIGCAVGAVQALPAGVWIAMNGRVWDPARVRKNREANRFEAVGS